MAISWALPMTSESIIPVETFESGLFALSGGMAMFGANGACSSVILDRRSGP